MVINMPRFREPQGAIRRLNQETRKAPVIHLDHIPNRVRGRIQRIRALLDDNIITVDEFDALRRESLSSIYAAVAGAPILNRLMDDRG